LLKQGGVILFSAKLAAVGYGIKKLVITCVVEDDKVGTDDLDEWITAFEEYVSFSRFFNFLSIRLKYGINRAAYRLHTIQ
jgi:hypothetical protein